MHTDETLNDSTLFYQAGTTFFNYEFFMIDTKYMKIVLLIFNLTENQILLKSLEI